MLGRFVEAKSRKEVEEANPGAAEIIEVCGGFVVFDTLDAYEHGRIKSDESGGRWPS